MAHIFFFITLVLVWIFLIISIYLRPLRLSNIIIGIAAIAYSLVFDTLLGTAVGLYHYISPRESALYTVLAAVFIYAPLDIVYTLFFPNTGKAKPVYTGLWIAAMLLFEYASVKTGTVVFTGWRPIPWSFLTYIVTYGWINLLYRYLDYNMRRATLI